MTRTTIKVDNISKQYRLGSVGIGTLSDDIHRMWAKFRGQEDPFSLVGETNDRETIGNTDYVFALKDINFEVKQGEILGIIGKNGAGKSTLLKILSKVTSPSTGSIKMKGRVGSLLEVGTGFHPELTGRENIYINGAILGMRKWEIDKKLEEIVNFSGVERYIDTPVKRYSSGMKVRLGFAVAAHLEPEILIVDEVLAVGDAEFQKKCIGKMRDVSQNEGRTILFVSHNMASIRSLCTRGIMLEYGKVKYSGSVESTISEYLSTPDSDIVTEGPVFQFSDSGAPFRFIEISICNSKGKPSTYVEYTEEAEILLKFEVKKKSTAYSYMTLLFLDNHGNYLFALSSEDDKLCNLESKDVGEYSVKVKLPSHVLKPGHYKITPSFYTSGKGAIDQKIAAIGFEVVDTVTFRGIKSRYRSSCLTAPLGEWSGFDSKGGLN